MTREEFIRIKNMAVKNVMNVIERDPNMQKLDPISYNNLRHAIRGNFNWVINKFFDYLHLEHVPLKRENNGSGNTA